MECELNNIESVRHSVRAIVEVAEHSSSQNFIMCNTSFENFRATAAKAAYSQEDNAVIISPKWRGVRSEHGGLFTDFGAVGDSHDTLDSR